MNLDTERLKTKIQLELNRIEQEKINLEKEISRLQAEKDRLNSTFDAVETVERIAKEIEMIRHVGSATSDAATGASTGSHGQPVTGFESDNPRS